MTQKNPICPDCSPEMRALDRRDFLKTASAAVAVAGVATTLPVWARAKETTAASPPESIVKILHDSLSAQQKSAVCYDWDHIDSERGLLRTHISANWHINDEVINSDFFTDEQRKMIRDIFEGIVQPDWYAKFDKQLEDDCGGLVKTRTSPSLVPRATANLNSS